MSTPKLTMSAAVLTAGVGLILWGVITLEDPIVQAGALVGALAFFGCIVLGMAVESAGRTIAGATRGLGGSVDVAARILEGPQR